MRLVYLTAILTQYLGLIIVFISSPSRNAEYNSFSSAFSLSFMDTQVLECIWRRKSMIFYMNFQILSQTTAVRCYETLVYNTC